MPPKAENDHTPRSGPCIGRPRGEAELLYLHGHLERHADEVCRLHAEIDALPRGRSPRRDYAEHLLSAEARLLRVCAEWMRVGRLRAVPPPRKHVGSLDGRTLQSGRLLGVVRMPHALPRLHVVGSVSRSVSGRGCVTTSHWGAIFPRPGNRPPTD